MGRIFPSGQNQASEASMQGNRVSKSQPFLSFRALEGGMVAYKHIHTIHVRIYRRLICKSPRLKIRPRFFCFLLTVDRLRCRVWTAHQTTYLSSIGDRIIIIFISGEIKDSRPNPFIIYFGITYFFPEFKIE